MIIQTFCLSKVDRRRSERGVSWEWLDQFEARRATARLVQVLGVPESLAWRVIVEVARGN